jgi:pyruvate formate lyase activating enzyme
LFLKGCPLRCWWCHNPESQRPDPEVLYSEERCLRCGDCVAACPQGALRLNSAVHADRSCCRRCGTCADACLAGARQFAGARKSVEEVLAQVERDRVFYEESGGGVTLSGGEPLHQSGFAAALLAACRERGIHTTLDTCGYAPAATFQRVAEFVDLFLFDLKVIDGARHREMTGAPNDSILVNLRWLAEHRLPVVVRVPVIPGCTDDADNLAAIRTVVRSLGLPRVDLLPYHRVAMDKYKRLGLEYRMGAAVPPSAERMQAIAADFARPGLDVRIGG